MYPQSDNYGLSKCLSFFLKNFSKFSNVKPKNVIKIVLGRS